MATLLRPPVLDRQVTIEWPTVARDATYGAETITWVAGTPEWAEVLDSATPPGSNPTQALAMAGHARPTRVRIRWRTDVHSRCRVRHAGRLLQVLGVAELGRQQWLELACTDWAHQTPEAAA